MGLGGDRARLGGALADGRVVVVFGVRGKAKVGQGRPKGSSSLAFELLKKKSRRSFSESESAGLRESDGDGRARGGRDALRSRTEPTAAAAAVAVVVGASWGRRRRSERETEGGARDATGALVFEEVTTFCCLQRKQKTRAL
jgi:hypothetical protein